MLCCCPLLVPVDHLRLLLPTIHACLGMHGGLLARLLLFPSSPSPREALSLTPLSSLGLLGEHARLPVIPFDGRAEWLTRTYTTPGDGPPTDGEEGDDGKHDEGDGLPEPLPFHRHTLWDDYPLDTLPGIDEEAPSPEEIDRMIAEDLEWLERRDRERERERQCDKDDYPHSL